MKGVKRMIGKPKSNGDGVILIKTEGLKKKTGVGVITIGMRQEIRITQIEDFLVPEADEEGVITLMS